MPRLPAIAAPFDKGTQQRVNVWDRCNQACVFCNGFISKSPAATAPAEIRRQIRAGRGRLILTGKEPTLCPDLERYVRLAGELGYRQVVPQSNGRLLADAAYCRLLAEAGLAGCHGFPVAAAKAGA